MLALILYWFAIFLLFYTFVGFTLILILRAYLFPKPYESRDTFPSVTMVISAYNEETNIEDKIKNILELTYPRDRLEVIIASDGSTDRTNEIVRGYTGDTIKLLELEHRGKAAALNTAIPQAKGEIIVFSDANSLYAKDAIQALTRPFADEHVGGVAGDQRYTKHKESVGSTGEQSYWNFDRFLKQMQTRAGNATSATGAIYAIRRKLFPGVLEGATDDYYVSTRIILQGYRLVFAADAASYEPSAKSQQDEFGRKVRIMTRGLYGVYHNRALFNPFKFGFYSLQVFTHKALRRLMYIPLIILFFSNIPLISYGLFYQLSMVAQLLFYGLALIGWLLVRRGVSLPRILSLPTFFCMVYWAALLATWNLIRGRRIKVWTNLREESA